MLPLPSTKYPNVQRTVTGLVDVFPDDVIFNCNTAAGTVTISLGEIPHNATTGVGNWSTQYKLYINDISNNAGTNNITLVAGLGQTINNAATAVLNTNGASAYVIITGNTEYSVFYAPSQATPTNFISVTWAQLTALITANTLIPSANYNVTDAEFGSTPIIPTNIYIQALTTNTVSLSGQGYFLNADYQAVGNYSGVPSFTAQLGVWTSALVTPIGSVVIWNNFQYVNTTGVNGAVNPQTDVANWAVLPRVVTNGYVVEISFISYNPKNNRIVSRRDQFNNFVERTILTFRNSLNFFKWGSLDVRQNNVSKDSVLYNCNITTTGFNSFFGNDFFSSEVILGNGSTLGGSVIEWSNNLIELSPIIFKTSAGTLTNNKFNKFSFEGENTGTISENNIQSVSAPTPSINSGTISNNVFKDIRTFTITDNSGIILKNEIISGAFEITIENRGGINNNVLNNSGLTVETNSITGVIENNYFNTSSLNIKQNEGAVQFLEMNTASFIQVTAQIQASGVIQYLKLDNNSSLVLGNVAGVIGSGLKGKGNTINNNSKITIGDFYLASGFYGNSFDNGTILTVTNFDGSILLSNFYSCEFYLDGLSLNTITVGNFSSVVLGNLGLSYVLQSSIQGETAILGLSTVPFVLDCSDLAIYNAGTQTLTIPPDIAGIGGVYTLTNAGGKTITKIISLSNEWGTTFYNDNGTTTFQSNAVGVAVATDIVSPIGAGAYLVVYRALGQDSIVIRSRQNLAVVTNSNILL